MSTTPVKNVGKGTPTVFWDIVPDSDKCEIYTYMAGGGCTLPGKAMVLMPGAGYEGVTKFVMDVMTILWLKRLSAASCRCWRCNICRDCSPAFQESTYATDLEATMKTRELHLWKNCSKTVSMQLALDHRVWAVKYSVMGVHIENTARHPSTIGVAVNVGCWSHRRGHIIFDKDLNYTITTHSGVTL